MLTLVGLGLWDEKDLSLRAVEVLKTADVVYLEHYTQPVPGLSVRNLEKLIEKRILPLSRTELEEHVENIVKEARTKNICILVGGDPFVATTHNVFIPECKKHGVVLKTIHAPSIFTAVCKTGLEIYKFGRTVTIPFSFGDYRPTSFYDHILENLDRGLHTLVLLDLDKERERYMHAKEGILRLLEIDEQKRISSIVVLSCVGGPNEKIMFGEPHELLKKDLGDPPFTLVVPGKLSEVEEVCLNVFKA